MDTATGRSIPSPQGRGGQLHRLVDVVEPWCSEQPRNHGALSCSDGRSARGRFFELGDQLWPSTKRARDAEREVIAAREAMAADEEGATERVEAVKDKHQL